MADGPRRRGIFTLLETPASLLRGAILTAAGAILLLFSTDVLHDDAWSYVWPSVLIAAGLVIVARRSGRTIPAGTSTEDVVVRLRSSAVRSSSTPRVASAAAG